MTLNDQRKNTEKHSQAVRTEGSWQEWVSKLHSQVTRSGSTLKAWRIEVRMQKLQTQGVQSTHKHKDHEELDFRVPKSLGWRGFKIIFFMIYLWFEYDFHLWFFYGFKLWLWFFYGLDMIFLWHDFFMVFLVLRIWFSAKNSRSFRFFYDFARVSFSPKPFQQKIWFWKQNRKKIVKKS